jgi:hypothetical protein
MKHLRAAAFVLAMAGCTKPAEIKGGAEAKQAVADPWTAAVAELRRSNDTAAAKRILNQLSSDLTSAPDAAKPVGLSAERSAQLAAAFHFDAFEKTDLNSQAFTSIDAQFVADAFLLRDAAAALDTADQPPVAKAATAFAWIGRQVYRQQWLARVSAQQFQPYPPVAPTAVLRRGYGTGLERAYVFLAIAQQLGLDAVLVGAPGLAEKPCFDIKDPAGKGPFWAVGVRTDAGVYLFDPWRGEPVPGPGGKGIATLSQLQAAPELVRPWADDKSRPWDVSPAMVKEGTLYATAPLPSLSPRMKLLEEKLGKGTVRLAVELPAGVAVWAPGKAADPFAYPRATALLVGSGRPGERTLSDLLVGAQVPADLESKIPATKSLELRTRLVTEILGSYLQAVGAYNPREGGTGGETQRATGGVLPRDLLCRGQFNEFLKAAIAAEGRFGTGTDRAKADATASAAIAEWLAAADAAFARVTAAKLDSNPAAAAEAESRADRLWTEASRGRLLLLETTAGVAARAEFLYLIGLAKHEQAERAQARYVRNAAGPNAAAAAAAATAAWSAAADAWARYTPLAEENDKGFPGRAAHAAALTARSKTLALDPTK